ncbi:MlaD family protein [Synoicihabitans lomoniglobus]|uniref:MlaD family protein n=1 Tax=Synoicihabitans lomoniglobus TaxID=2909285 RepID=A0AAE9ZZ12_9BACT|nr:MlaD family protein [Opitutaceae bacterium LMO-M01]WED65288.1 MlaD family protein [Opitutaceae bacterium LMO-M01]
MKTKVSPTVVGFFVIGAMIIGMIGLFSFGSLNFLRKPQRFMVYFDESVSGLDEGSPVKLRGVRVGRVSQVSLTYNNATQKSVVAVLCDLNRAVLTDLNGELIDVSDRAEIEKLIEDGLRAQLGVIGLATGLLYVELDFKDPLEYPVPRRHLVPVEHAVVPAVPSTISEFQNTFTEILANVKDIDFSAMARELQGLLADSRKQIKSIDLAALGQEWTATAKSIRTLTDNPAIPSALANLDGALGELRSTLQRVDGAVDPTVTELAETLQQARTSLAALDAVAATTNQFISAQSGIGAEAAAALRQLGEASRAIAQLADFLERNPSALLTGRAKDK